jgi:hypothetical protein
MQGLSLPCWLFKYEWKCFDDCPVNSYKWTCVVTYNDIFQSSGDLGLYVQEVLNFASRTKWLIKNSSLGLGEFHVKNITDFSECNTVVLSGKLACDEGPPKKDFM